MDGNGSVSLDTVWAVFKRGKKASADFVSRPYKKKKNIFKTYTITNTTSIEL